MMRRRTSRGIAVVAAAAGLLTLGATAAQAATPATPATPATAVAAATPADPGDGQGVPLAVSRLLSSVGALSPGLPDGLSLGVPEIVPGVPSIGIIPSSLPALPITPTVPVL